MRLFCDYDVASLFISCLYFLSLSLDVHSSSFFVVESKFSKEGASYECVCVCVHIYKFDLKKKEKKKSTKSYFLKPTINYILYLKINKIKKCKVNNNKIKQR